MQILAPVPFKHIKNEKMYDFLGFLNLILTGKR